MTAPHDAPTSRTVLLVEDDATLAAAVRYNLERDGFHCLVAADGVAALACAQRDRPDLVLLDRMLPGIDGLEVCRRLRARSTVPIIIISARVAETDRVVGLEVGADDYVIKPFAMRELLARVRALLRRVEARSNDETEPPVQHGDLRIDPNRRELRRAGQPLNLKPKEFDLLLFLARRPGRIFTREQLLDHVWGYDAAVNTRTVDVHVRWLREKIEADPARPLYLLTARGVGYRFEGRTAATQASLDQPFRSGGNPAIE